MSVTRKNGPWVWGGNANGNAVTVKALTGAPLSNVIGGVSESPAGTSTARTTASTSGA